MLPGEPQPLQVTYIFHTRGSSSSTWRGFFQQLRKCWWGWEPHEPGNAQLGLKPWCWHPMNMQTPLARVKPCFGMAG